MIPGVAQLKWNKEFIQKNMAKYFVAICMAASDQLLQTIFKLPFSPDAFNICMAANSQLTQLVP